jgi:hypothetical protein
MEMINRVAVLVRPKEPYLAWARQLDEEGPSIHEMAIEDLSAVYLMESADDPEPILRRRFGIIFEEQLESWHRIPGDWPLRRTYDMFRECPGVV